MDAKEYLNQTRAIDIRINANVEKIENLREMSTSLSGTNFSTSRVQDSKRSNDAAFVNSILKITELENEIDSDTCKLIELKEEISKAINSIQDSRQYMLLQMRYINLSTWDDIAFKMNYSLRTIHRIHIKALESIQRFLNKVAGETDEQEYRSN